MTGAGPRRARPRRPRAGGGFDLEAAMTRARMAQWEDNLRRFEGAARTETPDGFDDLEALDELDDLEDLENPDALRNMAERLGLPSPVGADGQIDPAALAALAERAQDMLQGGPAANRGG